MRGRSPSGARIVGYFFLLTLVIAFLSLGSPVPYGTIREIPQSPAWSEPLLVQNLPAVMRIPSFAVDTQGVIHVVYVDRINEYTDLFYSTVDNGKASDPQPLTEYPSLKESVTTCIYAGTVYVAFLDNREGRWQVYLLDVDKNQLVQITDTPDHKEDLYLAAGVDNLVITWTDLIEGVPHILLSIVNPQGEIIVDQKIVSTNSTKASTVTDKKIHIVYLEKQVYDHIMYAHLNFSGEVEAVYDLGENIHLDPVKLGLFKGPQFVVSDTGTITCVWSDSKTGSHNLYSTEVTKPGDIKKDVQQLTDFPIGAYSWMPCITNLKGVIHIVYVNNAFGHRIFHAKIDEEYQELGTVTSGEERATAPFLDSDGEGLHCMYLRFGEEKTFDLMYRNTYPSGERQISLSERMEESGLRYVYSFGLSFLFAFPLTFKDNFIGIVLLVCGFFVFRFFNLREYIEKFKRSEYILLLVLIGVLSLLRGPIEYSLLALVFYDLSFVVYGFILSLGASVVFKYLLGTRFDFEIRILLSCLVFLYLYTLVLLLPVIQHI